MKIPIVANSVELQLNAGLVCQKQEVGSFVPRVAVQSIQTPTELERTVR